MVSEHELDLLDDASFGWPAGVAETSDSALVAQFRSVGLTESSAAEATRGLQQGVYFDFADAVMAATGIESGNARSHVNWNAVAEAAAKWENGTVSEDEAGDAEVAVEAETDVVDEAEPAVVSEALLDALDDAVFGKPGHRR